MQERTAGDRVGAISQGPSRSPHPEPLRGSTLPVKGRDMRPFMQLSEGSA